MFYEVDGHKIEVVIKIKKTNKHIYLRFKDNTIFITSYVKLSNNDLYKLLNSNLNTIKKYISNQEKVEQINSLHLFGLSYEYVLIESNKNNVLIVDDKINIYTKKLDNDYIKKIVEKFYILKIKEVIELRLPYYKKLFNDLNTNVNLKYNYAKTFFGKYNKKLHEITFSGILAKVDYKYIDYVICHELSHIKYNGHQSDFYNYLETKLKESKTLQKELRRLKYKDKF